MKRGRRVFLTLLGCVAVGIVVALVWPRKREPSYQGKSLSKWVEIGCHSARGSPQEQQAMVAVQQMGTNALPYLLDAVAYEVPAWRRKLMPLAVKVPFGRRRSAVRALAQKAWNAEFAVFGFRALGPAARAAVPQLERLLSHTNRFVQLRALNALGGMGQDGLPPLLAVLKDEQAGDRGIAFGLVLAICLDGDRTNASWAVPVFVRCLRDKDVQVVGTAAEALGKLGMEPGVCVPALTELAQQTNWHQREAAVQSLGCFGREAVPTLLECLRDTNLWVRMGATNAVRKIAPEVMMSQ